MFECQGGENTEFLFFEKLIKLNGTCFGLYIDVLSVSTGFNDIFCIYEHIFKYIFGCFRKHRIHSKLIVHVYK